jgi:hypothetical protein
MSPRAALQESRVLLEEEFVRLTKAWRNGRGPSSSISKFVLHPAYQQIIGLGPAAVPLILRELSEQRLDHWFWALRAITGEDPARPEHAGNLRLLAADWLRWGAENGYIDDPTGHSAVPKAG